MKQRRAKRKQTESRGLRATLAAEAPGLAGLATLAIVYLFHERLFADLHNYPLTILLFLWLFGTLLWCAFSVVRHADVVAEHLGEPYGTLVLTLSVIIIEVSVLACTGVLPGAWEATKQARETDLPRGQPRHLHGRDRRRCSPRSCCTATITRRLRATPCSRRS